MEYTQSPATGSKKSGPHFRRKPLQSKNFLASPATFRKVSKPIHLSLFIDSNKENCPEGSATPLDASLAEELSAIRAKLERLRLDREKTERVLREKDLVLEKAMEEMEKRGKEQRNVEIEIQSVWRLKELGSTSERGPLKSLRQEEREKKMNAHQAQASISCC